mgnify:CR=1 FL=1
MNVDVSSDADYHRFETVNKHLDTENPPTYIWSTIQTNCDCPLIHFTFKRIGCFAASLFQALLLIDRDSYNADLNNLVELAAFIILLQLLLSLLINIAYGHLCSKFGQKAMIYYGAFNYLASCIIITTRRDISPGFIIGKLLLTNAEAALDSVLLTTDYIHKESMIKGMNNTRFLFCVPVIWIAQFSLKFLFSHQSFLLGKSYTITSVLTLLSIA